jgi:hypothetical protein
MDYISRDEALKALQDARIMVTGMRYGKTVLSEYAYQCKLQYLKTIIDIPGADVTPVRKGRWITVGKTPTGAIIRKCSACETVRKGGVKSRYCRDCGADMSLIDELDGQMSYLEGKC